MTAVTESAETEGLSVGQSARALARRYLGNRKVLAVLALLIVGGGLALNWGWLVAAGLAPILLSLAPCAAMCALGLCMNKMGSKACSDVKDASRRQSGSTGSDATQ